MTDEQKLERINELLQLLMGSPPIVEFSEPKTEMEAKHRYALAQMYVDESFRSYVIWQFNDAVKSSALRSKDAVDISYFKARAIAFKELLVNGKRCYEQLQRVNDIMKNHGKEIKGETLTEEGKDSVKDTKGDSFSKEGNFSKEVTPEEGEGKEV